MAAMSPTQLSLRWIREQGYTAQVVERWNSHAKIRQDLFGCIDILAIGNGQTVAIQTTSWRNVPARIKKMDEMVELGTMCEAGWIVIVQGWQKPRNRWVSRERRIYPGIQEELWATTLKP